ncbi:hypothetical protein K2Z83_11220 [Oscillochloris sp. ZM17-4]|uniref:hypothetical protein n=1 Tax=Oscillochloris sp. ZM17-4 TaxID=2866714 RepID=UPI001C73D00B|nr:hypothetical protein [Oscillochloris sp. ZM17-4]MBX0328247.1 hypothetical protein [Oscillochloris sp. ZM17-4]
MDGSARAPKKRGRPSKIPPAPTADVYAAHPTWIVGGPLPAHPHDLWKNACPAPTAAHADQLAALAAEHDTPTSGNGWYWVGRAILAGLHAQEQLGHPNYLRNLLIRWRAEDSYGSDLPRSSKETVHARPKRGPRPTGPARGRSRVVSAAPAAHRGVAPTGAAAPGDADLSPEQIADELARLDEQARIQLEQRRRTLR